MFFFQNFPYTIERESFMKKIYETFEQLVEQNKAVFDLLMEKGQEGILKACWDARDPQLDALKDRVCCLEKSIQESENRVLTLQTSLEKTISENEVLEADSVQIHRENTEYHDYFSQSQEEILDWSDKYNHLKTKYSLIEKELETLKEEVNYSSTYIEKLTSTLEKSEDISKHSQMNADLLKADAEHAKKKEARSSAASIKNERQVNDLNIKLEMMTTRMEKILEKNAQRETHLLEIEQQVLGLNETIRSFDVEKDLLKQKEKSLSLKLEKNNIYIEDTKIRFLNLKEQTSVFKEGFNEAKDYALRLKRDAEDSKKRLIHSDGNVKKLKEYSDTLKMGLSHLKFENEKSLNYITALEKDKEDLLSLKDDWEGKFHKLNRTLFHVQKSIGQISESKVTSSRAIDPEASH